jgi:hypothetical protein
MRGRARSSSRLAQGRPALRFFAQTAHRQSPPCPDLEALALFPARLAGRALLQAWGQDEHCATSWQNCQSPALLALADLALHHSWGPQQSPPDLCPPTPLHAEAFAWPHHPPGAATCPSIRSPLNELLERRGLPERAPLYARGSQHPPPHATPERCCRPWPCLSPGTWRCAVPPLGATVRPSQAAPDLPPPGMPLCSFCPRQA